MLVTVNADEDRLVCKQVDELLLIPPLIIAQTVRPIAARDLVVVPQPEEIELSGIERIAVGVQG